MQGKVRIFNVISRALAGIAQGFEETFRNLPARIAATNLRNYALGHKVRYIGTITNLDTVTAYVVTARELLHALGTISYKDAWGAVYDAMMVDRIYAGNLEDRIWGWHKPMPFFEINVPAANHVHFIAEVILPYAPNFFASTPRDGSFYDGMFACSLLGEEASIRLAGIGAQLIADPDVTVTVECVRVDTVCCQTKELVQPIPIEFRDDLLAPTTNPYISTGDVRKYNHVFVLSQAVGTTAAPVVLPGVLGALNEILIDADGHVVYQGPAETQIRGIENYGSGAPFAYHGLLGTAAMASMSRSALYGEMYSLIDPMAWEKSSQGQACKRLEIRGIGPMENQNVLIMSERRYECPSSLFERWADREGLSAQERKDLRIGGVPAGATKLRRSEAVGVPIVVSSRKERKE